LNFLKDGNMVRSMNGELKDVIRESDLREMVRRMENP
jgi:hypothetical protein